jgi:hypothetical protein
MCVCVCNAHVNIHGGTACSEAIAVRQPTQNVTGCCSVKSQSCVEKNVQTKNALHIMTQEYHNYLTLFKTDDAQLVLQIFHYSLPSL